MCFTELVAASMNVTEFEPIETTSTVRRSGEKPNHAPAIGPYKAD
jgi:hypothetical protein